MVAFDTNVLVRVLVGDDPVQTPVAERAFIKHAKGNGIWISLIVLAEISWVLVKVYQLSHAQTVSLLSHLIETQGVTIEQPEIVSFALDRFRHGKADLADLLILGSAKHASATPLVTFDKALSKETDTLLLKS